MAEDDMVDPYDPEFTEKQRVVEITTEEQRATQARRILEVRRLAYHHVFTAGIPEPYERKIVLDDLKRFCFGDASPWHDDERIHCLITGRFEVFQRIEDFTRLGLDDLVTKYDTKPQEQRR